MINDHDPLDILSQQKPIHGQSVGSVEDANFKSGGNDASIVLPDVDIASVAPEVVLGAFGNSGQICVATKRIYIHESIYEPFVKAMVDFAKTLKVGSPNDSGVALGPIQNKMQYDRVKGFFEDSKAKGYKFVTGSTDVDQSKGYFVQPTIIDNPPNDSRIIVEEPFGKCSRCGNSAIAFKELREHILTFSSFRPNRPYSALHV